MSGQTTTLTRASGAQAAPPAVLKLRTPESRVSQIARMIESSPAFSAEAKKEVRACIHQHTEQEAIAEIFLKIIAPVLQDGDDSICDLYDCAEKLYDQIGDPSIMIDETANQHVARSLSALTGQTLQQLESAQAEIEKSVEKNYQYNLASVGDVEESIPEQYKQQGDIEHATEELAFQLQNYSKKRAIQLDATQRTFKGAMK